MASKKGDCVQFCIRQSLRKKNATKRAFEEKNEAKKKWQQNKNEEPLEVERHQDEKENGVECGMENRVLAPGCHDKEKQNQMKNVKEVTLCLPVPPMNSVPQLSRRISKRQSMVDPSYSPKISPVVATRLDVFYVDKNESMAKSQRKKSQKKKESSQSTSM